MARQIIDTTSPGDTAKAGGDKINDNFAELYGAIGGLGTITLNTTPVTGGPEGEIGVLVVASGVATYYPVTGGYSFVQRNSSGNQVLGTPASGNLTNCTFPANLATYNGIAPSANVQTLLASANYAAFRSSLGLVIGTNVQAWDADLDTWATKTAPSGTVVGTTDAQTLTNKRITPRVVAITYASTVTPNADSSDVVSIGALTGGITIANPSGTPTDGQILRLRIAQDGTGGRAITWGNAYAFGTDVTEALIPDDASAKWELVLQWHAGDSKWRAVGIARGF